MTRTFKPRPSKGDGTQEAKSGRIGAKPGSSTPAKIVVGMVHLLPLAGAPLYGGSFGSVLAHAVGEAEALAEGGVQALMLENFGDVPFYPEQVPMTTVAQMTAIACEVRRNVPLPLGINVLRNDAAAAMAVAQACGAAFIRVNVLSGARVCDQGLIAGKAHDLMRLRRELGATDVEVLADIDVKHSAALAPRPLEAEVDDVIKRALADALIVSGTGTGGRTDPETLRRVVAAAKGQPVLVGSGVTAANIDDYAAADGFIVGTSLKTAERVDVRKVQELVAAAQRLK